MRKTAVGKNERRLELKRFEQSDSAFIGAPSLTFMLPFFSPTGLFHGTRSAPQLLYFGVGWFPSLCK